jgi:hypothetical protein
MRQPLGSKHHSEETHATSPPLDRREVGLRFNNWDRIRAERIPILLTYAAACGADFVLLLLIATGALLIEARRRHLLPNIRFA